MPGHIQSQPISGRVDNATKTLGWGSIPGWVKSKTIKIGIYSFSCLTFSIKRDIVKPLPCVVDRWEGAGGRLTRDFRAVSWPKRIGKLSSSTELARFRMVIVFPRLAILFDHMHPLSPVHFSSSHSLLAFSTFVSVFLYYRSLQISKPSLSHFHLLASKHDRTTAYYL